MWEIETNSVANGPDQSAVGPGQPSCVGSPPRGVGRNERFVTTRPLSWMDPPVLELAISRNCVAPGPATRCSVPRRAGRPGIPAGTTAMILRLAREHPPLATAGSRVKWPGWGSSSLPRVSGPTFAGTAPTLHRCDRVRPGTSHFEPGLLPCLPVPSSLSTRCGRRGSTCCSPSSSTPTAICDGCHRPPDRSVGGATGEKPEHEARRPRPLRYAGMTPSSAWSTSTG